MAMDYAGMARQSKRFIGKGTPLKRIIAKAKEVWQDRDEKESAKVRVRSGGRCEVTIAGKRCPRRAFQVHHHKGGNGVRGRGDSALAKHKTHCCTDHHTQITGKTLQHARGNHYREVA